MDVVHLNQEQLAARWHLREATLERWRSEGLGPKFLKLCGRVIYRQVDIEAYEERLTGEVRRLLQEPPRTRGNRRDQARKNPNRERSGFCYWWSRRESNPRPEVFCDQFYVCSDVFEFSLPLRRRTGSTDNQLPNF